MKFKNWVGKKRLRRKFNKLGVLELNEINTPWYGEYDFVSEVSKPKYRSTPSKEEKELIDGYVHLVYDPPISYPKHRKNHDLKEYFKGET
ncbi:hypothetical protein GOV05_05350 [Candidatus Woesearchaeota archaeon]|nr:hypothetical protein [Candidatus Woesearchaeota archaeon]